MDDKYVDIVEQLNWIVHDEDPDYIELEKYSPAGEDFIFSVEKENLVENVKAYAREFNVDEHVRLWIDGIGENGVPDSISALVEDAENIREMLFELAGKLCGGKPYTEEENEKITYWYKKKCGDVYFDLENYREYRHGQLLEGVGKITAISDWDDWQHLQIMMGTALKYEMAMKISRLFYENDIAISDLSTELEKR